NELKSIQSANALDLIAVVSTIVKYYNYKLKHNLYQANLDFGVDLIPKTKKLATERLGILDTLYNSKVLEGGKYDGHYECVECKKYKSVSNSELKPSKNKMKCPNCDKEMLYIIPYRIYEEVYKDIVHSDGILTFAIEYLLLEKGYNYTLNNIVKE